MTTLQKLSKKDKYWREVAYNFCKNKSLSDDLVQEMYLKLMNKDYCNDFYVIFTIKHLWLTYTKRKKTVELTYSVKDTSIPFEYDDNEIELVERFNKLPWHQQELILEHYHKSYRDINKEFNIDYGFAYREVHKGIKEVLGDDYHKYNNSNMKIRKQTGKHKK